MVMSSTSVFQPCRIVPAEVAGSGGEGGVFGEYEIALEKKKDLKSPVAQAILQRIAMGDRSAVEDCMKAYGGLAWALARRMLNDSDDAEDAVQEIFVDIWKTAAKFDPLQASETTFVAMIARRRLIDRIRHGSRRISTDPIDDLTAEPSDGSEGKMQLSLEAREAARALDSLRPEQRRVLQLSIIQGLTHQEISEMTGMPLGTVKTHARRGLLQAREFLGLAEEKQKEASL